MGIYQRDRSPYWWLSVPRPGQPRLRESTRILVNSPTPVQTARNRQLAEETYAARLADLARQRYQLPTARRHRTLADHIGWYRQHVTAHKRGKEREGYILDRLVVDLGQDDLASLTRDRCLEWRTARAGVVRPGTINREFTVLRAVLSTAVPIYLDVNPTAKIKPLYDPLTPPAVLTRDEERRLLAVCDAEGRAVLICALDTLMRLTDVITLDKVRDKGAYLLVPQPKVAPYEVPVSTRLRAALDGLTPDGDGCYFPSGRRRGRKGIARWLQGRCRAAGIRYGRRRHGLTFHGLRHTGASRMLEAGVDIRTVQELGGWRNLQQLTRYLHPTQASKKAAVEAVSQG